MADPHIRVVGQVLDEITEEPVILGVDYDSVTIKHGAGPAIVLGSYAAEEFAAEEIRLADSKRD